MLFRRVGALGLVLALGLGTAACTEDGYGYSGVSLGYGSPGYYDYGYAPAHYGWYGDYYYPGSGYYVYDRARRPHRWNEGQRRYWETRRNAWRGGDRREIRENWADFRRERRRDWRDFRGERRDDRAAYRRGEVSRPAFRTDRQQDRREYRRDYRQDRRELRRDNRRDRRD